MKKIFVLAVVACMLGCNGNDQMDHASQAVQYSLTGDGITLASEKVIDSDNQVWVHIFLSNEQEGGIWVYEWALDRLDFNWQDNLESIYYNVLLSHAVLDRNGVESSVHVRWLKDFEKVLELYKANFEEVRGESPWEYQWASDNVFTHWESFTSEDGTGSAKHKGVWMNWSFTRDLKPDKLLWANTWVLYVSVP